MIASMSSGRTFLILLAAKSPEDATSTRYCASSKPCHDIAVE